MKRLTEAWESALPPAWLSAIRRRFGHGVPSPSSTTTLAGLAASDQPPGGCDVIQLGGCPRLPLPGFSVSGDFVAVEAVRSRIGNRLALEQYDRLVAGPVVQPQVDSFVAVLAEARVCQSAGLVITAENALLADVSDLAFVADDPAGPLGVSHLPRPRHTPLTVAVLTTGPHHNYYHWMIEALPRLDLYERSGVSIDCFYAPVRTRFQRESLDLLGISPERILPATRQTHLAPARLVASSFTGSPSLAKTDYLSRRLGLHAGLLAGRSRRIFIARAGRRARAIANEKELLRSLEPLGFERLRLEAMPLVEQVSLFQQAECVVGPHGAGLTNLMFCRPGTQVIEIGTPYRPWSCFYEISHHRGLAYHLHLATPVQISHFDPATGVGDSGLRVDPAELARIIETLLAGRTPERVAA